MSANLGAANTIKLSQLESKLSSVLEELSSLDELQKLKQLGQLEHMKTLTESSLEGINRCLKHIEGLESLKDLKLVESLTELRQLNSLEQLDKLDKLEDLKKLDGLEELYRLNELKNLIFLEELHRLDKINELSKLEVIDRLDATLTRHHETLRPLKHLDELEKLTSLENLKSLSELESLKKLTQLDKIALLENLDKLDNLKSLSSLDNLRQLMILDELKNLDQLKKLQKLEGLDKLSDLKNLDQLEKLAHLHKLDRLEDKSFAEQLNKLDKLDILNSESKKLFFQQLIGTGLDVLKLTLAVVFILVVLSSRTGQSIVTKVLPLIGFSNSAQTSLGLQMLMGSIPDEQFEQVLSNVRKKIDFEMDSLFSAQPLPLPVERLGLIKQLNSYEFSEFGADLSFEVKTKMDEKTNALRNQVIEALDFSIGLKKSQGNKDAEKVLREVKILVMNGKFLKALELSLPFWGSDKSMNLVVLISLLEMEKAAPELIERVLNRPVMKKKL